MAEGVPASQPKPWRDGEGPEDIFDDEEPGSSGPEQDSGEEAFSDERVAAAWGKPARAVARKRPRSGREQLLYEDAEDGDGGDQDPELAEFFGDIPPAQQIAICRAYASYLAAQHRGKIASSRAGAKYPVRSKK